MTNPFEIIDKRLENLEGLTLEVFQRVNSSQASVPADMVYTKAEAAKFLNITEQTLSGYVSERKVPYCKPTDGRVYFLHSDLIDWLRKHRTATLDEATEAYNSQRTARRKRTLSSHKEARNKQ
ncbi:helix-turn-helix domain-containing protein [Fibrella sp. ES10-3-2-2]|nr:hypothetical protein A6C57_07010 [Fibrella sp. ES10-3-2-2]